MTSLNTISLAVVDDNEPFVRTVLCRTVANTLYNQSRTHLSLRKDAPLGRRVQRYGTIATTPILSGLHHRYARI